MLAVSTMLDPPLKKIAYADAGATEQCVQCLTEEMSAIFPNGDGSEPSTSTDSIGSVQLSQGLWQVFDQQVADANSK